MPREVIGPEVLAERLGISVRSVYRMVRDDELPYYRVGRQLRFDADEVLARARRKQEPTR